MSELPKRYKGASIFIGIRLRNPDGSYQDLDNIPNLVILLYAIKGGNTIVARKNTPVTGELPIRKMTSTYYYIKVPGTVTALMDVGETTMEIGKQVTDGDITKFIVIGSMKVIEICDSEMKNQLK